MGIVKCKWIPKTSSYSQGFYDLEINDKPIVVPSISKILDLVPDPDLDSFFDEVGEEKAKEIMKMAADRGTAMHLFLENYGSALMKGKSKDEALSESIYITPGELQRDGIPDFSVRTGEQLFMNLIREGFDATVKMPVALETPLTSWRDLYRGKFDLAFMNFSDEIEISDYKSSSKLIEHGTVKEKKYLFQTAAYWNMWEENFTEEIKHCFLWVSTKEHGTPKVGINKEQQIELYNEFYGYLKTFHLSENGLNIDKLKEHERRTVRL